MTSAVSLRPFAGQTMIADGGWPLQPVGPLLPTGRATRPVGTAAFDCSAWAPAPPGWRP